MNGIEKIIDRIMVEANAEADTVKAEAEAKCAEIKAQFEAKAKEEYEKIVTEGEKAAQTHSQRLGNAADMEARKGILSFKQSMVAAAFERAQESILNMPKDNYIAFLAAKAAEAAAYGTEELVFNEKDKKAVGAEVAKKANELLKAKGAAAGLTVCEDTVDIPGGLVVRHGDIEVNCSIDTLVKMHKNDLASKVAEILFA